MNALAILRGACAAALLLPAVVLGALWVRAAWRTRDLHTCLTLGAVVGLSAHIVALNALSYLLLPGFATVLLVPLEALAAVWLGKMGTDTILEGQNGVCPHFPQSEARGVPLFSFEACRADVRAVWPWLAPVALVWMWQLARTGSSDQLAQALFCEPLARRGLPAFHPLDTTQLFNYHYGLPLVAAGLGTVTGLKSWWALNAVLVLLIPALLGACVEFLRAAAAREGWTITRPELVLGTLLFALGGNLCWVEALRGQTEWLNPARVHVACDGLGGLHAAPAFLGGWTWLLAVLTLMLRRPGDEADRRPSSYPAVPLGLSVGALALIAEHSFLAVGMVLAIVTVRSLGRSWREAWPWLLVGALGLGLACVQGGAITGLALGLSGSKVLSPHWTGHWLPTFPTIFGRVTPTDGAVYWTIIWREYAHTLVLLPLLLLWAFSRRGPTAARWLLGAAAPGVLIAFYVSFPLNDFDTYRFYQTYFTAAMLVTGLWLAKAWLGHLEVPPGRAEADAAAIGLPKPLVVLLAAVLLLQGVHTSVLGLKTYPELPWDVDPDQERALRLIEAQGRTGEGVLCSVPNCLFQVPPSPIVWGRAVPASDPDTDVTVTRSRAWQRAWVCPSPANLRTARARWVLFSGADLARAAPMLEGLDSFTRVGEFGPYRLYRYNGTWEIPEDGLSDVEGLEDYTTSFIRLSLGPRTLTEPEVRALGDGRVETVVDLDAEALADEGLIAYPSGMRTVNAVWLRAGDGASLLDGEAEIGVRLLTGGLWVAPGELARFIRSPGHPEALAIRFGAVDRQAVLIKMRRRGPGPASGTVRLTEVWVGRIW